MELVLRLHVHVPPKQVHAPPDGRHRVEGAGGGPQSALARLEPGLLVDLAGKGRAWNE